MALSILPETALGYYRQLLREAPYLQHGQREAQLEAAHGADSSPAHLESGGNDDSLPKRITFIGLAISGQGGQRPSNLTNELACDQNLTSCQAEKRAPPSCLC